MIRRCFQKTQFQYESTNGDPSKTVVKVESVNTNSPSESVQGRLGAGSAGCVPFREFLLNRIRMNQGAWMILAVRDLCLVAFWRCFFSEGNRSNVDPLHFVEPELEVHEMFSGFMTP